MPELAPVITTVLDGTHHHGRLPDEPLVPGESAQILCLVTDLRLARVPARARVWAGLAAVATILGAVALAVSVAATRRLWFDGYVSEAGVASSGHSGLYKLGIAGLSVGQLLLGTAIFARTRLVWIAGLLVLAGLSGGVSATMSCSPGCPLPPHETPTAGDLVHAGGSILAIGSLSLAILGLAFVFGQVPGHWPGAAWLSHYLAVPAVTPPDRGSAALIGASRVAAVVVVPLVAAAGLAILIVGRGHVTGLLERAVLVSATVWTLVMCRRLASYAN
jgi:hypothetical protein